MYTFTYTHTHIYIYICNCSATFTAENSEIIRKQECKQTISTTSIIKFQITEFFLLWKTSDHPASLFLSKKFNETQNLFKISIYKSNFQLDNEKQSHDHDDYCLNLYQICSSRAHDVLASRAHDVLAFVEGTWCSDIPIVLAFVEEEF